MAEGERTQDDAHRFAIGMEDGAFWLTVDCPYEATDETRPCWPHNEDGSPMPAPQKDCTYQGWVDSCGIDDILHGRASFPLPAQVVWDDYFEVHALASASPDLIAPLAEALRAMCANVPNALPAARRALANYDASLAVTTERTATE